MQKLLAQVRRWGRRPAGPAPSYEVACPCGAVLRGARQARRQVVPCPGCGRFVFVLAWSGLPPPEGRLMAKSAAPRGRLGPWALPLIGATATLAVLVILFLALLPLLARPTAPPKDPEKSPSKDPDKPADVRTTTAAGSRALAEGEFDLAVQLLQSALDQDRQHPEVLAANERSDLTQLWRQADLLSRLSSQSLQEIVEAAEQVSPEGWKIRFEKNYKGKTVVFDDEVQFESAPAREDGRRRPVLRRYRVAVGDGEVRLALEDLTVLQALPLERPQRMLFGGRLSAVERGPDRQWVVRFDPDSGVLLTDRGAAAAVCPAPLDPALADVLKRQAEWVRRQKSPGD